LADAATSESRVSEEQPLRTFAAAALTQAGVAAGDAAVVADVLVAADVRGSSEHGVARLPGYVRRLRAGTIVARPDVRIVRESATAVLFDAGNGLGAPAAARAMEAVVAKAAQRGAAFGAVRNSNHFGIAGYYAMLALAHDQIGIASTNAARAAVPTFGRERMFGDNPFAFAIPAGAEPPFVLDFATTQRTPAGDVVPLGGPGTETSGHKGYGLALLADILCGVLAGGAFGPDLPLAGAPEGPGQISHFFAALRVDGFLDAARLRADLDRELRSVKDSPKSPGYDRIYVAGELEHERTRERRERGIPIHATTWDELDRLAGELGVPNLEHFPEHFTGGSTT
jgi:L-2-hydroxycarboxylate dehydrogenase (NAD+)